MCDEVHARVANIVCQCGIREVGKFTRIRRRAFKRPARFLAAFASPGATPRGTRIDPSGFAVGFLALTPLLCQQNTQIVVRVCILRTDPERFAVREGFD
jgi:hypothetical protein